MNETPNKFWIFSICLALAVTTMLVFRQLVNLLFLIANALLFFIVLTQMTITENTLKVANISRSEQLAEQIKQRFNLYKTGQPHIESLQKR